MAQTKKLRFEIHSATSFDEEHSPNELVHLNAYQQLPVPLKGWISEKFCLYPQCIVIRFPAGKCTVRRIQVLSHHSKISSKLEFYIGQSQTSKMDAPLSDRTVSTGDDEIQYTRLGFVSLGDNSSSDFKARELKSVHVHAEGQFLKIVFHKNHVNALNLYNQIGLASLTIFGEADPLNSMPNNETLDSLPSLGVDENADVDINQDFSLGIYQDHQISSILAASTKSKQIAVKEENFGLARLLKMLVEVARKAAREVAKLLLLKAKSIEMEDYQTADEAKADVEQIRKALLFKIKELGLKQLSGGRIVAADYEDLEIFDTAPRNVITTSETVVDVSKVELDAISRAAEEEELRIKALMEEATMRPKTTEREIQTDEDFNITIRPVTPPDTDSQPNFVDKTEITLPPLTRQNSVPILPKPNKYPDVEEINVDDQLGSPEPLNDEFRDKYDLLIQVYGEFTTKCLLSKNFRNREKALEDVKERVKLWKKAQSIKRKSKRRSKSGESDVESVDQQKDEKIRINWNEQIDAPATDKDLFISATFLAIGRGLDDTREKACLLTLSIWHILTKACNSASNISTSMIFSYFNDLIPELLKKSANTNQRIKQACQEQLVLLAAVYHTQPQSIMRYLVKPIKANSSPRYIIARLEALVEIIDKVGVDDLKENLDESGLSVKSVMNVVEHQLHNKNVDVREAAVKVFVKLAILMENDELMLSYLEHIRSHLVQIIQERLASARKKLQKRELHEVTRELGATEDLSKLASIDSEPSQALDSAMSLSNDAQISAIEEIPSQETEKDDSLNANGTLLNPSLPVSMGTEVPKESEVVQNLKEELSALKTLVEVHINNSRGENMQSEPLSKYNASEETLKLLFDEDDAGNFSRERRSRSRRRNDTSQHNIRSPNQRGRSRQSNGNLAENLPDDINSSLLSSKAIRYPGRDRSPNMRNDFETIETIYSKKPLSPGRERSRSRPKTESRMRDSYRDHSLTRNENNAIPEINVYNLSLSKSEDILANNWDRVCIFCGKRDPSFTDEKLDLHYWSDCVMLCSCPLCQLIVEIPSLTSHMIDECENKKLVKQCSRCREAVMTEEFKMHVERKTCLAHSEIPGVSRCPLCHKDIPHGEAGWKKHLLSGGVCATTGTTTEGFENEFAGQRIRARPRMVDEFTSTGNLTEIPSQIPHPPGLGKLNEDSLGQADSNNTKSNSSEIFTSNSSLAKNLSTAADTSEGKKSNKPEIVGSQAAAKKKVAWLRPRKQLK